MRSLYCSFKEPVKRTASGQGLCFLAKEPEETRFCKFPHQRTGSASGCLSVFLAVGRSLLPAWGEGDRAEIQQNPQLNF